MHINLIDRYCVWFLKQDCIKIMLGATWMDLGIAISSEVRPGEISYASICGIYKKGMNSHGRLASWLEHGVNLKRLGLAHTPCCCC